MHDFFLVILLVVIICSGCSSKYWSKTNYNTAHVVGKWQSENVVIVFSGDTSGYTYTIGDEDSQEVFFWKFDDSTLYLGPEQFEFTLSNKSMIKINEQTFKKIN